ncbi:MULTISPECIES: MATE family efflux transporter [unclassified Clostridium]|uniref:MATE family efflux transporter n=1 Tax=Clostridium TaxID=1485 RepID=UPI0005FAC23A|nr:MULTISPECIES: MATE family efflux transporter [unclassified Clostridium]KQB77460.1 multidrug transporter MatE [Clostridium butyricum]KJZ85329.1 Multi antimicrobial extrusion protein (Na(+)/drug antiporter), MATE family of MDR efflux pump [Clostridium sp. IBUN125C]KJZ87439.1 Multi antimicrobial extrusion protein (Na(+)/drug antiporter), MATE family of MDR efflux pump [Clostridium sp. IBUN22A]KJZ92223.1 Multi antimicrobial extrusion protein (Na(+)/drug antiporter), MATE family of MDR efflux pum
MFSNESLKKLIIPIFMDQILIIIASIIATMMISYAGEASVSAVSLIDMINMLLINVLAALTAGGAVIVSQYIGFRDKNKSCIAASQLFTIATIISIGIMGFVFIFHKPLLKILFGNVDYNVMNLAITYFVIYSISYPFLSIYDSGAALFRSIGNSRVPMIVSIAMNAINIVGNAIGIFVFNAGVVGIAISIIISRAFAALVMVYLSLNKKNKVFISFSQIFTIKRDMIIKILNIAIPNGIENGIVQLGRILLISIIALFGTDQIAANGITNSLVMISISFATAMNIAIVSVIGQCVGAGDYAQADFYTKKLLKITYIGTIVISLAEILLLPWILNLYTLSAEVTNLTYILVIIHNCLAIIFWPLSFTLPNSLRASGDVRFTMIVSISSMFILRISFGYILGIIFNLGVIGVWLAMGADWMLRSIIYVLRFKNGKWREFKVI